MTGGSVGFLNLLSLIAGSLILPICCQYNDPNADQLHLARLFKGGIMIDLTIVAFVSHQLNCFKTEIQYMFDEFQFRRFKIKHHQAFILIAYINHLNWNSFLIKF